HFHAFTWLLYYWPHTAREMFPTVSVGVASFSMTKCFSKKISQRPGPSDFQHPTHEMRASGPTPLPVALGLCYDSLLGTWQPLRSPKKDYLFVYLLSQLACRTHF